MIVVLLLLMSLQVQAQDDAATCQSIKSQEAATIIRADIKLMHSEQHQPTCTNETAIDMKQIKEDLSEVKNRLGSCPQSAGNNETARDVRLIKEELAEVKNLLGSCQQPCKCSAVDSSSLCEYIKHLLLQRIPSFCVCNGSGKDFRFRVVTQSKKRSAARDKIVCSLCVPIALICRRFIISGLTVTDTTMFIQ